jgi:ATP-dependent helicase HrpA
MSTPHLPPPLAAQQARLAALALRDQQRLRRRIEGARRVRGRDRLASIATEIAAEIDAAELRLAARLESVPAVRYPEQLPIAARKDDIAALIRDHQVVVVAGETGSGKTTQLPKICLELGRGVRGMIGHTQPRRIAARAVADRIAEELGVELGGAVGATVRFNDRTSEQTLIKLMTDGILLAEIQHDRSLSQYDTLIIDEAHERSLNIDFILGYLKQLLPRRPDLKVIITSATIDPQRFSRHFGDAPVIEVSGRTYPVEVRYRPLVELADDEDEPADGEPVERDQPQAICEAVKELTAEGPGDILVFCSGEREIRDTAEALAKLPDADRREVLPLYARLTAAEQHRVFQPHGKPRVVVATNVAETSLTVPGIRYVIDPGTARVSRYSHRTKVQRLPIEAVSQASANQRKGRCGREAPGICVRLYAEADFEARPEFTDPEILRTSLASVILQMASLGLGDVAAFPFVDPPDRRQIKDGVLLLHELGALEGPRQQVDSGAHKLTPLGRRLARLPIDPRLARMVLEADRNGCLREVMVIAAALSIQDPRERPSDKRQAADEKHRRFADESSDFLAFLNLWNYLREKQDELTSNQFRRLCRAEFLNYLRIREWQDVHSQLRQVARQLGLTPNDADADPSRIHMSLLSGLLSHIGLMDPDKREYLGARNARFAIFPGSGLFKKPPKAVMAAELVETSRLWARVAAAIQPEWVEPLAGHLVKRTYSEPHWEKTRAAVMASERVTLYGVPIVVGRSVNYGRIDPELCRELFLRHALVEGDWQTHHKFFHANRKLLAEVEELENRARRRDILVDDETLFDFYDQRVPEHVVSGRDFDAWWKQARVERPDLLTFTADMLVNERAGDVSGQDYPDFWRHGGPRVRLSYQFEPGADADGVTAHLPLDLLNQISGDSFEWQVPGLRAELVTALIKALPKQLRRILVPAPDRAREVLARLTPYQGSLSEALSRELRAMTGVVIPVEEWRVDAVPEHLRMTFRIIDEKGRTLAEGKDLDVLRQRLDGALREALSASAEGVERSGLTAWELGELPRTFERRRGRNVVRAFPALVDEGGSVAVKLLGDEERQRRAMWTGTRRLLLLQAPAPVKFVRGQLSNMAKLALANNPHGSVGALLDDCLGCAVDKLMADHGGPAWDEAGFAVLRDAVRADLADTTLEIVRHVERILTVAHRVELARRRVTSPALARSLADIDAQFRALVFAGFVTATGFPRLPDLVRYLRAIERRLEKLPDDPYRDEDRMAIVQELQAEYDHVLAELRRGGVVDPSDAPDAAKGGIREVRWMLEELRVSYFAQNLGTPTPISDKRVWRALDALSPAMSGS